MTSPPRHEHTSMTEYSVDVWFLYGSFTYGLETRVCAYSQGTLTLEVALSEGDTPEDVARFLETLVESPRGLLRSELRVYGPGGDGDPIRLYTEVSPSFTQADWNAPRLRFSQVIGLTPLDDGSWRRLVTQVWPRHPTA